MKEVILEFIVHGSYVKVSAVDPVSGTEVSIVGDRKAEQSYLESVATKKLAMVMKKMHRFVDMVFRRIVARIFWYKIKMLIFKIFS